MQDNLLWVYEGQTQFWGWCWRRDRACRRRTRCWACWRAGGLLCHPAGARLAIGGGYHPRSDHRRARARPYRSLSRDEDYYSEGALVWLEADQIIRAGTAGRKGLDDFARAFFGIRDGDWGVVTYEFDDVVAALNAVYPYDWASFLKTRIEPPGQPAPLAGIEQAGYRLVWKEEPNPFDKARMEDAKNLDA